MKNTRVKSQSPQSSRPVLGGIFTNAGRRQRAVATAMAATMAAVAVPEAASATPRGPTPASIVYDVGSRNVMFEFNSNTRIFPASTTKLMTAYLTFEAMESGRLSSDQMLSVSRNAAGQPRTNLGMMSSRSERYVIRYRTRNGRRVPVYGTRTISNQVVSRISVDDAVRGLMVHSANDAAVVLGETLGGDRAGFARQMNAKARELGMTNSNFFNANGLGDDSQVTSARDMVILLEAIQRDFPAYYARYLGIPSFTYRGTTWTNTNRLLNSAECPGIDGGKTGYIRAAGSNIVLSAERGGHRIIVGVFGRASSAARNDLACNMVNYAFYRLFSDPATGPYDVDRDYPIVFAAPALPGTAPPVIPTPEVPGNPQPYLPTPWAPPVGAGGDTSVVPMAAITNTPRYSLNFRLRA